MPVALRSFIRLPLICRIAVLSVFLAASAFAQSAASPSAPASQVAAHEAGQAPCLHSAMMDIPIGAAIEAQVKGVLDSGHLKAGKEIWASVVYGLTYPGCTLNAGSAVYGHVIAVLAKDGSNPSELSLVFDHADCDGRGKKEMPLRLIGLVGPSEMSERMHDIVPSGLKGSQRNSPAAVLATVFRDDQLNPGGAPQTVHVGVVLALPKLKLDYEGGPGCSARITSTDKSVQLEPGTELILVVQSNP
jgi:hypothetical protein